MKSVSSYLRWPWLTVALATSLALLTLWVALSTVRAYKQVQTNNEAVQVLTRMIALIPGAKAGVYANYRALAAQVDTISPPNIASDLRTASDAVQNLDQNRTRLERNLGEAERVQAFFAIDYESALASSALQGAIATVRTEQLRLTNILFDRVKFLIGTTSGLIVLLILIARDLRSSRQALARHVNVARDSQERFQGLLEHILEGVYRTKPDGTILAANQALVNMLGYESEAEFLRANAADIYPDPLQRAQLVRLLEREGSVRNLELVLRRRDGELITVLENGRVVRDPQGSIALYEGTLTDITDRKRAEAEIAEARDQAIAASRLKSEFLANVSHEVRTPMNGVIGMTGLLLDTELTPEQRDYALAVRRSTEFLLGIINDILDFSKIEAGKLEFERIEFAIRSNVSDVLELLAEQAETRGLDLAADVADDVPNTVLGDPGRLRQVITNLVSNAIKFTHDGEVVVRVSTEAVEGEDVVLRFDVSDTGIGITPDQMQRIFEPFCQGDGSTTRKYGGTGLGLSISRRIVELMGGTISATSTPGAGSTFSFSARFATASVGTSDARSLAGVKLYMMGIEGATGNVVASHARRWGMQVARSLDQGSLPEGTRGIVLADADTFQQDSVNELLGGPGSDLRVWALAKFSRRAVVAETLGTQVSGIVTRPVRLERLRVAWLEHFGRSLGDGLEEEPRETRILIAEDNSVNQTVALRLVEKLGYRADVVETGAEALDAAVSGAYSLILMDCQMPEMDGFAATVEIRKREGGGQHLPIIAMTAHALRGDRERCLECGMDDYLAKPIHSEQLAAALRRWLAQPENGNQEPAAASEPEQVKPAI